MRKLGLVIAAAALVGLFAGSANAAPSSKFTALFTTTVLMVDSSQSGGDGIDTDDTFVEHVATVKVPQKKDLLIGVSIQTGIDTTTKVKGKNGGGGTAQATGDIGVVVLVGGVPAAPGLVTFDSRTQRLSAVLGGVIESCTDLNGDGTIDVATECVVTDEEIELMLSTAGAHHFNFLAPNLVSGTHEVKVVITLMTAATTLQTVIAGVDTGGFNSASATAIIGPRMVTIQTVRGANNPDSITDLD